MIPKEIKEFVENSKIDNKIRWIKNYFDLIIRDAEQLSSGNISHHKESIKQYAQNSKKLFKEVIDKIWKI